MKKLTEKELDIVLQTIDAVVYHIVCEADNMSIDPRHNQKVENVVDWQRTIAERISKSKGDIVFDRFGIDIAND